MLTIAKHDFKQVRLLLPELAEGVEYLLRSYVALGRLSVLFLVSFTAHVSRVAHAVTTRCRVSGPFPYVGEALFFIIFLTFLTYQEELAGTFLLDSRRLFLAVKVRTFFAHQLAEEFDKLPKELD